MINRRIYQIWSFILVLKLLIAYWFPVLSDEAYYWVWSKHITLSFYDHPPMVAWLIYLGNIFENFGHAFRWPTVILGHLSLLVWVATMKRWLAEKDLFYFFLLITLSPVTGFGTLITVPDSALLFFWPLSIFCLFKALETKNLAWYLAVGAACGLGFCSKYHMSLFLPICVLWLTVEKKWSQVKLSYLIPTFIVYFIFALPVFIWNYQHDWVSFRFQLNRTPGQPFHTKWLYDYLGSQVGLIFPTLLVLAVTATRKYRQLGEKRWLVYFAWFVPALFLFSSLRGRVEPNWTGVALPSLFALALVATKNRTWIKATLWIWSMALILILSEVAFHWLPIQKERLKTFEYSAYDYYLKYPFEYIPMYASSYQMASILYYKTKVPVYKLSGTHRIDQFDFIPNSTPPEDLESFYVLLGIWNNVPEYLNSYKSEIIVPKFNDLVLMRYYK